MPTVRSTMYSTCSLIHREQVFTSVTLSATSPATSTAATSDSTASMCFTQWVTMLMASQLNSTLSRQDSTQPSLPTRTSHATASSSTALVSASIGIVRCAPANLATTSGHSGLSRRCSSRSTATSASVPSLSRSSSHAFQRRVLRDSMPHAQKNSRLLPTNGTQ